MQLTPSGDAEPEFDEGYHAARTNGILQGLGLSSSYRSRLTSLGFHTVVVVYGAEQDELLLHPPAVIMIAFAPADERMCALSPSPSGCAGRRWDLPPSG